MIDEDFYQRTFLNAGEIDLEIEKLEKEEDSYDKRSKEYKEWKNKINHLIMKFNQEVGHKALKIYK